MGLILDLAVVALAVAVIGSLAFLAWTLAVSAVRGVRSGRAQVERRRQAVTDAEARLLAASERASASLGRLSQQTDRYATPGDRSDR